MRHEMRDTRNANRGLESRVSSHESLLNPNLAAFDPRPGRRLPFVVGEFYRGLVRGLDRYEGEPFIVFFVDVDEDG
jgi:hypothetical protein